MGVDAEETFAESNEDRDVEDGVGSQLVQLNPVNKEESPKELMNRQGEAAKEKISKNYPISFGRIGVASSPGILIFPSSVSSPNFFSFR